MTSASRRLERKTNRERERERRERPLELVFGERIVAVLVKVAERRLELFELGRRELIRKKARAVVSIG